MSGLKKNLSLVLLVIVCATAVFCVGNFDLFLNPYLINDDVQQQLFWMERWRDPLLFEGDFLTVYSESYVPIGVRAVYWFASYWFNPLLFSNILTAILYLVTAGLFFVWGQEFGDRLTAFLFVSAFFLFTGFLAEMAGGLSRSFVLPLLVAYLLFISQDKIFSASLVILIQSFFNPYVFLLCLLTHTLIMAVKFGPSLFPTIRQSITNFGRMILRSRFATVFKSVRDPHSPKPEKRPVEPIWGILSQLLILNAPVILGLGLACVNVLWYQSHTGYLISWTEMIGKSEYGELGRYELYPVPSFYYELIKPWIFNLSFPYWGSGAGWIMAFITGGVFAYAAINSKSHIKWIKWKGLYGFLFMIPASILLYVLARVFLIKLFVPSRYIYYSLNLLYCVGFAMALRIFLEKMNLKQFNLYIVLIVLMGFACIKSRHVEFYDFSYYSNLYKFIETTPKDSLIAGCPEIMDNVMTFGKRPAYLTYELSHTWVQPYWNEVKKRTFDLFTAYYSSSPEEIKRFCKSNYIKYLIVRSEDFDRERLKISPSYFEPFNGFIWYLMNSNNYFAVLDKSVFPPIFEENGIRVLRIE